MKISDVIVLLTAVLASAGDMKVFAGDMKPIDEGHFDVCESVTDNPVSGHESAFGLGHVKAAI